MKDLRSKVFSFCAWFCKVDNCPDCTIKPGEPEPCEIYLQYYVHEKDCGVLEDINALCAEVGINSIEGYIKDDARS